EGRRYCRGRKNWWIYSSRSRRNESGLKGNRDRSNFSEHSTVRSESRPTRPIATSSIERKLVNGRSCIGCGSFGPGSERKGRLRFFRSLLALLTASEKIGVYCSWM